ncbi:MAG: lysophospholipid acyltransferase family protein [Candidatus Omnitrophica bacterium]|nr:lysophospholipid acyltransferase family protein [Candidatus Omnitrophota bacterium]
MFRFLLFKIFQFLVNIFPMTWSYRIAISLADAYCFFNKKEQAAIKRNLQVIDPDIQDFDLCSKEVFRNFGFYLLEFLMMHKLSLRPDFEERFEVQGFEHIQQFLDSKKPLIMATGHLGNWELGASFFTRKGFLISVVALPHKEKLVNNFFDKQRESYGVKVVSTEHSVRLCLKALQEKRVLAIVSDKDFSGTGRIVKLFGKDVCLPRGAALFAHRVKASVAPVFILRKGNGRFIVKIFPLITFEDYQKSKEHDTISYEDHVMLQYTAVLEQIIKQYPSQWIVFKEFWK